MDIYILTWYEGSNYGSVLQAYALRQEVRRSAAWLENALSQTSK